MKKRRQIASFFLTIFVSFLILSCTNSETGSNEELADRIQSRLSTGDYKISSKIMNPYNHLRREVQKVHSFYKNNHPNFSLPRNPRLTENFKSKPESNFKFTSNVKFARRIVETWGIDNQVELDQATNEMYQYYQNQFSYQEVQNYVQGINDVLTQYPFTYDGTIAFFDQQVTNGNITSATYDILQSWLNALVASNSIQESIAITTMVEQEILNSTASGNETLLQLTSATNGLLEMEAISMNKPDQNFQKTAAAAMIIGGAIAIIGMAMIVITDSGSRDMNYNQQSWLGITFIGALIFVFGSLAE